MSAPLWMDCSSIAALPPVEEIRLLTNREQHLVMRFPVEADSIDAEAKMREVIERLSRELPGYSVFDSGGEAGISQGITVLRGFSDAWVMAHASEFAAAAAQFRAIANSVMAELAAYLQVSLEAFNDQYFRFNLADDATRGSINAEWQYWFHGFECCLGHSQTGQQLDVYLGYDGEFGLLNPYFFHTFLETTPEYEALAALLPDKYHDTSRVLEVMEREGLLQRVTMPDGRSGCCALPAEAQPNRICSP